MKIASWNTEGRLTRFAEEGRRGSPEQIIEEIERLDSDVLFLPEAFDQARPMEHQIRERLEKLKYTMLDATYADSGSREYAATVDPHMLFLSRLEVSSFEQLRLGDIRNMLVADIVDPATGRQVRVFGVHLDDRTEEGRLKQLEDLLPLINDSPSPTVVMGDFNAMYGDSLSAHILRSRMALEVIDHSPVPRIKDMLQRLSQMAIGDTMRRITEETNLVGADPKHRLTMTPKTRGQEWMPSIPLVQIDHILASPDIVASNFVVARDGGSDHRAISATISIEV